MEDKGRKKQIDIFLRAYNMACDSINEHGVAAYRELVARYCGVGEAAADSIPAGLKFGHAAVPRKKDIELADSWLARQ